MDDKKGIHIESIDVDASLEQVAAFVVKSARETFSQTKIIPKIPAEPPKGEYKWMLYRVEDEDDFDLAFARINGYHASWWDRIDLTPPKKKKGRPKYR